MKQLSLSEMTDDSFGMSDKTKAAIGCAASTVGLMAAFIGLGAATAGIGAAIGAILGYDIALASLVISCSSVN